MGSIEKVQNLDRILLLIILEVTSLLGGGSTEYTYYTLIGTMHKSLRIQSWYPAQEHVGFDRCQLVERL